MEDVPPPRTFNFKAQTYNTTLILHAKHHDVTRRRDILDLSCKRSQSNVTWRRELSALTCKAIIQLYMTSCASDGYFSLGT